MTFQNSTYKHNSINLIKINLKLKIMKKIKILGTIVLVAILVININLTFKNSQIVRYTLHNVEAFAQSTTNESSGVTISDCYKTMLYECDKEDSNCYFKKCGTNSSYPTLDACKIGYMYEYNANIDDKATNKGHCVEV
jgi:hypothetical protein